MIKNFKEKECIICGKKFIPNSGIQKCCSKECANIHKKECKKKWNIKNKEHIKEYNYKNRDKRNFWTKRWRENNKEYVSAYAKKQSKLEHIKEYRKSYNKKRKKEDLGFKLNCWCRNQIYRCINSKKDKHTFDILGYTPNQLKQRLEFQFKPDMTWDNYGKLWNIDHRKPLCKFNFINIDNTLNYKNINIANSLSNLKPVYIQYNLKKSGRSELDFIS